MDYRAKSTAIRRLLRWGIVATALIIAVMAQSACPQQVRRPLNPGPGSRDEHSAADRAFRIAFEAANEGDYDTAAINYRRASLATLDPCDKAHAGAGETAALEAKAMLSLVGKQSKTSQLFWMRIQELTKGLPCVWVR